MQVNGKNNHKNLSSGNARDTKEEVKEQLEQEQKEMGG